MKSASQAYCTSAAKGLMLFMQHSPYSAISCCSLMRCTTKHKSPSESLIEHSQQHEKLYARTLMPCNTLKRSSDSVRTGRRKKRICEWETIKSYWQTLALRNHREARHLSFQMIFFWRLSRRHIWKGHVHHREKMMHTHTRTHTCTLSWGESVGVFVVLFSCLCTICLLKPPVCP